MKNFDDEQVWQQLELQNNAAISSLVTGVAKLLADKKKISFHSKQNIEKEVKGNPEKETKKKRSKAAQNVGHAETKNLAERRKEKSESLLQNDSDEDGLDSHDSDPVDSASDSEDKSDDELTKIKSRVEDDPEDKFFDFTGDSDDDLNFDFGPLSKGGLHDDYENDNDDGDDGDDGGGDVSNTDDHDITQKSKKSVRFKDFDNVEAGNKKKYNSDLDIKYDGRKEKVEKTKKGIDKDANKKGSIVDDAFFKLADMEAFLDQEDRRETRRQKREDSQQKRENDDESGSEDNVEEDIDVFADLDSEDEVINPFLTKT